MDIKDLVDLAKSSPNDFQIIGKGGRCLGLVHKAAPGQVLLLETGKESVLADVTSSDKAHDRAVTFARQYDEYISAGAKSASNSLGEAFVHSELMGAISPKKFGEPLYLHIGKGNIFIAQSARLVKRIPGQALHYLDFVDPQSPIDKTKRRALACDIAKWMYVLHHSVSMGALVANKIEKQCRDVGKSLTSRALNSEKHRVLVTENIREIQLIEAKIKDKSLHPEFHKKLSDNMESAGIDFVLLVATAKQLDILLKKIVPTDRIGLTHSDLHPANFIAASNGDALNGVCDWMTGTINAQSIDFAGIGLARGMLPKVVREYKMLEKQNNDPLPINYQAVFAYAAMRQIFIAIKAVKNGFGDGVIARVAWEQVGESVDSLGRLNPKFQALARRHKHQCLPPLRMPANRSTLGSRPQKANCG